MCMLVSLHCVTWSMKFLSKMEVNVSSEAAGGGRVWEIRAWLSARCILTVAVVYLPAL